jgi:hypothetical protein
MDYLLFAIATSVGAAGLMLWAQARAARRQETKPRALPPPVERTPLTLQVGDVVEHLDRDYLVEGALVLSESPRAARVCRLVDGATERFLFASTHASSEVWLLAPLADAPDSQADEITHAGERLRLERRWRASSLTAGRMGSRTFDAEMTVFEYVAGTGRFLLVLLGPTRTVAFFGDRLLPHAIEILPGKG